MSTMLEHNEVHMKITPRKFRDVRHPASKNTVTVPMAIASEVQESSLRKRQMTPTAVDLALVGGEADSHASLLNEHERR